MPIESMPLPDGTEIRVLYVASKNTWAGKFYNGNRMKIPFSLTNTEFHHKLELPGRVQQVIEELEQSGWAFDAVVSPPSSRNDAVPFREAILKRWPVRDLTPNFARKGNAKAGGDSTLEEVIAELTYTADGSEPGIRSILIIDESTGTGKTAAAVLHHLKANGLSSDAETALVVCVKNVRD